MCVHDPTGRYVLPAIVTSSSGAQVTYADIPGRSITQSGHHLPGNYGYLAAYMIDGKQPTAGPPALSTHLPMPPWRSYGAPRPMGGPPLQTTSSASAWE
jgi:hypothetical protein